MKNLKILYFHAKWCSRCAFVWHEFLLPLIKKCEVERIDVDIHPELAMKYTVDKLPCTIFIHDGKVKYKGFGGVETDKLLEMLENDKN